MPWGKPSPHFNPARHRAGRFCVTPSSGRILPQRPLFRIPAGTSRRNALSRAPFAAPIRTVARSANHKSGTISGVAAIYNRHADIDERRKVLENWEGHLLDIISKEG